MGSWAHFLSDPCAPPPPPPPDLHMAHLYLLPHTPIWLLPDPHMAPPRPLYGPPAWATRAHGQPPNARPPPHAIRRTRGFAHAAGCAPSINEFVNRKQQRVEIIQEQSLVRRCPQRRLQRVVESDQRIHQDQLVLRLAAHLCTAIKCVLATTHRRQAPASNHSTHRPLSSAVIRRKPPQQCGEELLFHQTYARQMLPLTSH